MAARLFYLWRAEEDLADIYRAAAARSPERARVFVASIEARCESLLDFPRQGRARDDIRPGVRILPIGHRVVVAYRIVGDDVEILRVFQSGRDFESLLREPREP